MCVTVINDKINYFMFYKIRIYLAIDRLSSDERKQVMIMIIIKHKLIQKHDHADDVLRLCLLYISIYSNIDT